MSLPLRHVTHGRSYNALYALTGIYAALILLVLLIDLNVYIALFIALFTLPALVEFFRNPVSRFELTEETMRWSTPRLSDEMPTGLILRARLDTRLDLSVKVTLLLKDNRRLRLPHACVPPHEELEAALKSLGIKVERHHFSLIG